MATPTALSSSVSSPPTAGAFQDSLGNVLANGKITFDLSQTASVSGGGEVAPIRVTVTLDVNGKVSVGQSMYRNTDLLPNGTTYRMQLFDNKDNFAGDFGNQSITGGPPIDLALLVPVSTGGGTVSVPGVVLLNPSASQTISSFPLIVNAAINAVTGIQINGIAAVNTFLKGNGTNYVSGSPILASADFANQGTSTTLLHGNAAGNPSFGPVNLATDTTGSLPISGVGAPTGTGFAHTTAGAWDAASKLVNLTASTDVAANQGSTVTVLHGNAAGQPSFGSVSLTADVTGVLPLVNMASPTGTGFSHVTAGAIDAASKLVNLTASTDVAANQGTANQVLHGNAAGQPSFSVVTPADAAGNTSGSGSFALTTSPALTTPSIGSGGFTVAGATSGTTTITATAIASGVLTLPAATDTLVGKNTTDTFNNKTIDTSSPNTIKINGNTLSATAGTATVTIPNSTDTLVGKATTDTLTNKTLDTAGAGNVLKINGTQVSAVTGTGAVVLATSPTLVTPILGVASATSITLNANNSTTLPSAIAGYLNYDTTGHHLQIASQVTGVNSSDILFYTGSGAPAVLQWQIGPTGTFIGSAGVAIQFGGATSGTTNLQATAVAGATTLTLPAATDTLVGKATTDTLTNKRVTPRQVSMADATSVTPTSDTADINTFTSTQAGGTLTVNAPSGTPTDGQKLILRLKSTNAQTYSFNATYAFSTTVTAPTTLAAGKTDYIGLMWNATNTKWDVVAVDQGH